jgi:hypothetical protein
VFRSSSSIDGHGFRREKTLQGGTIFQGAAIRIIHDKSLPAIFMSAETAQNDTRGAMSMRLEIRHIVEGERDADRIQNGRHVNDLLGDSALDRREPTERRGNHTDDA